MVVERTKATVKAALRREQALEAVSPDSVLLPATGSDDAAAAAALIADDIAPGVESQQFAGLSLDPDTVLLGSLLVAGAIAAQTGDVAKRVRMELVISEALEQLHTTLELDDVSPSSVLHSMMSERSQGEKIMLLIELALANPFAPHEHSWTAAQRDAGLVYVEQMIEAEAGTAVDVIATFADALRAHHRISLKRVGLYTIGAAAVVGGAGFLAAPLLGGALGSAAGLSGAAATSHGLALLGGMGGTHTMAAGTWIVAQAGAAAGAVGGPLGTSMYELGAARTQAELVKLQVAAKLILVDLQQSDQAAREVAERLGERLSEIEAVIEHQLDRNDPASSRIGELQAEAASFEDARSWIVAHCSDAGGGIDVDLASLRADLLALTDGDPRSRLDQKARTRLSKGFDARFTRTTQLDRYDVIAAVAAGAVAAVIDAVVVATPSTSFVTPQLRKAFSTQADTWLSKNAKVPFDQSTGDGLTPNTHRALTAGHDPLVGLVWGVKDILESTMNRSNTEGGQLIVDYVGSAVPADAVVGAVATQLVHLASDIITPAGLALPGWFALVISESTGKTPVDMYVAGYDTWHYPAMTIPAAAVNILVHMYDQMRCDLDEDYSNVTNAQAEQRLKAMLLLADAISCSGDIVELLATNVNPLVVNWSQWLTLADRLARAAHDSLESPTAVLIEDLQANQERLTLRPDDS